MERSPISSSTTISVKLIGGNRQLRARRLSIYDFIAIAPKAPTFASTVDSQATRNNNKGEFYYEDTRI